ncbi:acyl-CoA dehydrogenase family protein [Kribbella antibiotica]|uniref:acyl-CoA dehydrogenase family protein n=1 Tax=Kribbella antibiotica TaxID=190195 RepID=UPI0014043A30|nr:acyl-CoA dehydrogenase family protein [Kribbella antibiotica]
MSRSSSSIRPSCPLARHWQSRARTFAREYALPIGHQLDLMPAKDVIVLGSPYFGFMSKTREDFLHLSAPQDLGGFGLTCIEEYVVLEELATGDAALATRLFITPLVFLYAYNLGSPELIEELAAPFYRGQRPDWLGCFAITDANHGSDVIAAHTRIFPRTNGS